MRLRLDISCLGRALKFSILTSVTVNTQICILKQKKNLISTPIACNKGRHLLDAYNFIHIVDERLYCQLT
jgi:hypothetical protein